jgi:Zn-dependent metalloprotease
MEGVMKKLLFGVACLLLAAGLMSQNPDRDRGWRAFQSRLGGSWRPHFNDRRIIRSLYGTSSIALNDPQKDGANILRDSKELFGIDDASSLRLQRTETSELGTDLFFQQYSAGFPVAGGEASLHFNKAKQLIAATSNFLRELKITQTTVLPQQAAILRIERFLHGKADVSPGRLWIVPMAQEGRLAWRFEANAADEIGKSYVLYVDAANPNMILRAHRTYATADGSGTIFLENPVVTPTLTSQTFKNMDSSTQLSGNFVKVFDGNFQQTFKFFENDLSQFTTASDPNRHYDYPTTDARFSEAMAYFHINRVHDYWASLGFNKLNKRVPVFVNMVTASGEGYDNAFYTRTHQYRDGVLNFGSGKTFHNFAQDSDVFYHEYGHDVLDHVKPKFFEAIENNYPFAFHEAFGDISASSITGNSKLAEFALSLTSNNKFAGRNLENHNRFPQNALDPQDKRMEPHNAGLIVGGSWWDVQKTIGIPTTTKMLYRGLAMLPTNMTFFDVRDSMITADKNLNAGRNGAAILSGFDRHGLGGDDPGQSGNIQITGIKSGTFSFKNGIVTYPIKTKFKQGDAIFIVSSYKASNLTPGYNLVASKVTVQAPGNVQPDTFLFFEEVENGTNSGKNGAGQVEIDLSENSPKGTYTVTLQSRLGGTSTLTEEKTTTFQVQ